MEELIRTLSGLLLIGMWIIAAVYAYQRDQREAMARHSITVEVD